jgi:hypothetical protein
MNYIRNLINPTDLDNIDNLFDLFMQEINEIPFTYENQYENQYVNQYENQYVNQYVNQYEDEDEDEYENADENENTPEFTLNQSIINNAYLLRRTMELYPQEEQQTILRNRLLVNPNDYISALSTRSFNIPNTTTNTNTRRENMLAFETLNLQLTDNIFTSFFTNFNDFIEEQLNELEDVKVTLSEDEFNKLYILDDKSVINNKQCNICLENLKDEELDEKKLIQLKCNHIYHKDCIKEWLTKQSTKCPSCRFCCRISTNHE